MELNIEKTSFFQNEKVFNESFEQPIECELVIPDYCPEMTRILKCNSKVMGITKRISNQTLFVDGNVLINVLYTDEKNGIFSVEQTVSFYKEIEINSDDAQLFPKIISKEAFANCRATDSRKLEIRGTVRLEVSVFSKLEYQLISSAQAPGLQTKIKNVTVYSSGEKSDKYLTLNDDFELGETNGSINSVIKSSATVGKIECSQVTEKTFVKGSLFVKTLYSVTNGEKPEIFEVEIPFTQMVDIVGINCENCSNIKCNITFLEVRPRTGADGQCRTLNITAGIEINALSGNNIVTDAVVDAYSTSCSTELDYFEKPIVYLNQTICESNTFKSSVNLKSTISSIVDTWTEINSQPAVINENDVLFQGNIIYSVLFFDGDSTPVYYEHSQPYSFSVPISGQKDLPFVFSDSVIEKNIYTITGEKEIEFRTDVCFCAEIYDTVSQKLIKEICISECKETSCKKAFPLTIYYASTGEDIFDIAKKYKTTVDSIELANGISGKLEKDLTILIPGI